MLNRFACGVATSFAVASIFGGVLTSPARAADKPAASSKPAPAGASAANKKPAPVDPKALAALKPAIDALTKEVKDGMKDAKLTGTREKSDYFGEANKLPEGVTADVLLAALEQPINSNASIESYVKWQLMSGLPAELNEEQTARLYAIYHRAPQLAANPGLRRTQLESALYRIGAMNPKNDVVINAEFDKAMEQFNATNNFIVEYRNALYGRLPSGFQTLAAGIEDLFARVTNGLEVKVFWERVETSIRSWSATAETSQVSAMANALTKLQAANKDPRYKPYTRVIQSPDKNKMGLVWDERFAINDTYLMNLINDLHDAMRPGTVTGPAAKK